MISEVLAVICLIGGALFMLVAAVGILRLPDIFCRAHAVAKAMTLGIALMLVGSLLSVDDPEEVKGSLAIAFQFLTIPVASHLFTLVGRRYQAPQWRPPGSRRPSSDPAAGSGSGAEPPAE